MKIKSWQSEIETEKKNMPEYASLIDAVTYRFSRDALFAIAGMGYDTAFKDRLINTDQWPSWDLWHFAKCNHGDIIRTIVERACYCECSAYEVVKDYIIGFKAEVEPALEFAIYGFLSGDTSVNSEEKMAVACECAKIAIEYVANCFFSKM